MLDDESQDPYVQVVATKDINSAVEFVKTPVSLLLHSGMITPDILPESDFDDQERLVYLIASESRNPDSKWAPYFNVLPRTFSTPLHFTEQETLLLSHNPSQYGFAAQVAKQELKSFNSFSTKVNGLEYSPHRKFKKFSVATLRWAWSVVMSRGFHLPEDRTGEYGDLAGKPFLAPGSDFFNHQPGKGLNARIQGDKFTAIATRGAKEGEEIFFDYHRNLPNAWILNNYGFIVEDNKDDFLPLHLGVPFLSGTELENLKTHLLAELGLSQEINLTKQGLTTPLRNLLRIMGLNNTIGYKERDAWIQLDMEKDLIPLDSFTDARGLALMRRACARFLDRYKTHDIYADITEEEEKAAIANPTAFSNDDRFEWSSNAVMAATVRRAEMDILVNVLKQIDELELVLGISLDIEEYKDDEKFDPSKLRKPPTRPVHEEEL